ncbi:MAG: hypothetical protein QXX30_01930 [Candidatus Aenigmatarchaeota archaeon]
MYAIVYVGEQKEINTLDGIKILDAGMLLGYTEYPEEFAEREDLQLVGVEASDMEPFKWRYRNDTWLEVE